MAGAGRVLLIVMIILTALVVLFVAYQGIAFYQISKTETEELAAPSYECVDFVYFVRNPQFEDGMLRFSIENANYATEIIEEIEILSNNETIPVAFTDFIPSVIKQVEVDYDLGDTFQVYIPGCSIYATRCTISENSCRVIY